MKNDFLVTSVLYSNTANTFIRYRMKRWNMADMLEVGRKLFAKIHKRKRLSHYNNDIHFLAREIDEWLPNRIQSMIDGTYNPRCLKRLYFSDEVVDQLHLTDRIMQHILLKQLKPTFKHVISPNCHHLEGPSALCNTTHQTSAARR